MARSVLNSLFFLLFSFQSGVCHSAVLRPVSPEEVRLHLAAAFSPLAPCSWSVLTDARLFCVCSSMAVSSLEAELQQRVAEISPNTVTVYFNKGL